MVDNPATVTVLSDYKEQGNSRNDESSTQMRLEMTQLKEIKNEPNPKDNETSAAY